MGVHADLSRDGAKAWILDPLCVPRMRLREGDGPLELLWRSDLAASRHRIGLHRPHTGRAVVGLMIVSVEGAEDDVRGLSRIAGYHPSAHSARRVGAGRWAIDAEVQAEAVLQIEAAGCVVTVILDEAAMAEHEARVRADIDSGPPIA